MCKSFGNLFAHLLFGNILLVCSCHVIGVIKINGPYDMATFVGHKWLNICKVGDISDACLVSSQPSLQLHLWLTTDQKPTL